VRKPCKFTQADVCRALRAARRAGVQVRIEIAPDDGRISIITTSDATAATTKGPTGPNEWDGAR
jgi:hypothetical protein